MRQRYGDVPRADYQRPSDGKPLRVRVRTGGEGGRLGGPVPGEASADQELYGGDGPNYADVLHLRCDRCGSCVDPRSRVPGSRHRCGGRFREMLLDDVLDGWLADRG